jgi:hypothetical protein
MGNEEVKLDHWLRISTEELMDHYFSARAAMNEEAGEAIHYLRHLKNMVLFFQLHELRSAIHSGAMTEAFANDLMRGEFGLGYLFGLAANYVDACDLPRQSTEAKSAIFDVHYFTFGPVESEKVMREQNARGPESFDELYGIALEAAHKDVNSFKRVISKGLDELPSRGLRDGFLGLRTIDFGSALGVKETSSSSDVLAVRKVLAARLEEKRRMTDSTAGDTSGEKSAPYLTATRPDHAERYRTLFADLGRDLFGEKWEPSKTAIYGIAGSLNQQLALAQKLGIPKDALEAAIRPPFSLGYIFGGAKWHVDRYAVPRPGTEADKVILAAHREALGPLADTEIASVSAEAARSPEFNEGMAVANADFEALSAGRATGVFGLVTWITRHVAASERFDTR